MATVSLDQLAAHLDLDVAELVPDHRPALAAADALPADATLPLLAHLCQPLTVAQALVFKLRHYQLWALHLSCADVFGAAEVAYLQRRGRFWASQPDRGAFLREHHQTRRHLLPHARIAALLGVSRTRVVQQEQRFQAILRTTFSPDVLKNL